MSPFQPENRAAECLNILIVDDSEADIEIARVAFGSAQIKNRISSITEGDRIFDYLDGRGIYQDRELYPVPDLILMDIRMPKTDGVALLKQLKANPAYQMIPVIMLTSSRHERDVLNSYRGGASAYLQKPVSYQEFARLTECFNAYWQMAVLTSIRH